MKFRLAQQIEEVRYVIDHAYPLLRMRKSMVEMHTARMKAVLATLRWFEDNEELIREAVSAKGR